MKELLQAGKLKSRCDDRHRQDRRENLRDTPDGDREVIRSYAKPMLPAAGYVVMSGNLFDSAVMKISSSIRIFANAPVRPVPPERVRRQAIVFEGPEDYHHRIEDPDLGVEDQSVLIIRNCGPVGYPGSAEVVNMQPPASMLTARHHGAADHGRRTAVRHVRGTVDPERVAEQRSAADWRCCRPVIASASTSTPARSMCCCPQPVGSAAPRLDAAQAEQHDTVGGDLPSMVGQLGHGAAWSPHAVSQHHRDARESRNNH